MVLHSQLFNAIVKALILFIQYYSLSQWLIVDPFSIKYRITIPIILNASSPSPSFTPLSFILNHSNVRVVQSAIAHVHFANSESLIRPSVLTVVIHAPTIGLIVQHISFPSLSIITQIQYSIMFDSLHLLPIHSQQRMRVNTHFGHSIQTQLHHNGMGFLN